MITALILAAGESKRMGQPKMLLPWGGTTVLGQVIATLRTSGMTDILVITGASHEAIEALAKTLSVRTQYNQEYSSGDMLASIQAGLSRLTGEAALIALGDQPQVRVDTVRQVVEAYQQNAVPLVVPSFQMRRGHPWLVRSTLWPELLQMKPPKTPRDFLQGHAREIHYIDVGDPGIIQDLDTPEDYLKSHP